MLTTSGNTWTAAYTVNASDTPGAVTFSVAFSDTAGNAGTAVTSGSGSVAVDSTAPTMTIAQRLKSLTVAHLMMALCLSRSLQVKRRQTLQLETSL